MARVRMGAGLTALLVTSTLIAATVAAAGPAAASVITIGSAPRGAVFSQDGQKLYVANAGSNTVSVVNVADGTVAATISTNNYPLNPVLSGDGTEVFVPAAHSDVVDVISTASNTLVGSFGAGSEPQFLFRPASVARLYVSDFQSGEIREIDESSHATLRTLSVGPYPCGITGTADGATLYVANESANAVQVIDTSSWTVTHTIPVGSSPIVPALSKDLTHLYVSNSGLGTVSEVALSTFTVDRSFTVGSTPNDVAVSPDGHSLYTADFGSNTVSEVDLATGQTVASIPAGANPITLTFAPDGQTMYVADHSLGTYGTSNSVLTVVDLKNITYSASQYQFNGPQGVTSDGTHVWVSNQASNSMTEMNEQSGSWVRTISGAQYGLNGPADITNDGTNVWVCNFYGNTVTEVSSVDGSFVRIVAIPSPNGITFDGSHIWVTSGPTNAVHQIDPTTGAVLRTLSGGGYSFNDPSDAISDGSHVWFPNTYGNSVTEVNAVDGSLIRVITDASLSGPGGVATDGTRLWVANNTGNSVTVVDASTGNVIRSLSGGTYGFASPGSVVASRGRVFVSNYSGGSVTEIAAQDSALVKVHNDASLSLSHPYSLGAGASGIWLTNNSGNSVTRFGWTGPGAPVISSASLSGRNVVVAWTGPSTTSGDAIAGYRVTASPGGATCSTLVTDATPLSCTVTGLAPSTAYTFRVQAQNSQGWGTQSDPSPLVSIPGPPVQVTAVSTGIRAYSSVALSWDVPASVGSPISGYVTRLSSNGGVTWSAGASTGSAGPSVTLTNLPYASARLVEVAAVNASGQGPWSSPIVVTTKGGTQKRVYVQTSDGKPVSGGAITWSATTAHSSVTYGLTADGVIDFPLAPAGAVTVSLTDGVMPDGSLVSGTWNATLGFDKDVLKLPVVSSGAHRVHVTIPGGLPVGNASVSVAGLSSSKTVAGFSFRSPAGALSGTTDAAGLFTAYGYANGAVTATVVYDDGVITQTPAPFDASAADSSLELEFSPFVQASVASSTTNAGAAVPVVLSATAPTIPNPAALGFHALKGQPGVKVTLLLPAGAAKNVGTCKASLSGYTNATGKVTLKVCASKSGVFRVKSAGAVPVGAFTLLVKGKASLPPRSLSAKSRTVGLISGQYGTASLSWAKPFFTGGATVTKYTVTLSRAGAATITKVVTVKTGTKLALTVGGLTHAKTYTVRVTATTKYGTSDAAVTKVAVA